MSGLEELFSGSYDTSRGGIAGIRKFRGIFMGAKRKASRFEENRFRPDRDPDDDLECTFTEVVILRMEEGEEEPELKDSTLRIRYTYAPAGKFRPSPNKVVSQGFAKSAEALWEAKGQQVKDEKGKPTKGWKDLVGELCTMDWRDDIKCGKIKEKEGETRELVGKGFVFVENDASEGVVDIKQAVREAVIGLNKPAAKRALLRHNKIRDFPEYKEALDNGTLAEMVGLELVGEGDAAIFQELT